MTQRRLREDAVRVLAAKYGVPANPIHFAANGHQAQVLAAEAGVPVALKLVAEGVVHKSKAGGVILNVPADQVGQATDDLLAKQRGFGISAQGVTLEAMVPAGIEVVVGALHDPGFGPIVMFGRGGIDIEVVGDVSFALAPVTRPDAEALVLRTRIGQVINGRLPESFARLVDLVLAVGSATGMLLSEPVDQIDLNPIVVTPERIVAVDARAVTNTDVRPVQLPSPEVAYDQLRPAIYPRSIAVVGASADPRKLGNRAVRTVLDFGYSGVIYPVSRSASEVCGIRAVPNIGALPDGVDRAVVALPAGLVPGAIKELAAKGVRTAHVYTAGTEPLSMALTGTRLRALGPNCIGHYTPHESITMIGVGSSSKAPGKLAFISQSGTYAGDVVRRGNELGVQFSFVSSVGNCDDVSPSELLAFCERDDRTHVVAFYLEDDSDAGNFFRLAAAMSKPVILFKGGRTAAGAAAAASHTGALASKPQLLRDVAAQAGVALVDSLDELLDLLVLFQHVDAVHGSGLGLVGSGGGVAVVGSDTAHDWNLNLPPFSAATANSLRRFEAPGTSLTNPVDIPIWSLFDADGPFTGALLQAVVDDPAVDAAVAYLDLGTVFDMVEDKAAGHLIRQMTRSLLDGTRPGTPAALVLRSSLSQAQDDLVRELRPVAAAAGVPLFDSVDRAIAAFGRLRQLTTARTRR